jgi:hypothetical protein
VLVGATAACVNLNSDFVTTVWETQLTPELAYPGLAGQAAALSRRDGTDAGISIEGAQSGAVHAWRIRMGTCASPGASIGPATDYPDLVVDLAGRAETETRLGPRLAIENAYLVEVVESPTDETRIACGDLVAR